MKTCDLSISSNYHLFKQGIKPMWEDPANKHGGKWSIQLPRNKTMSEIDNIWLYTVSLCFVVLPFFSLLFDYVENLELIWFVCLFWILDAGLHW